MQIFAGIKKENLELFKTYRIIAFVGGFMFTAILNPFLFWMLPQIGAALGVTEIALFNTNQYTAIAGFISDSLQTGILVMAISMTRAAGGDQKNKTCVIPLVLGFSRKNYVLAKFAVYPLYAFLTAMFSFVTAYGISYFLFRDKVSFLNFFPNVISLCVLVAFAVILTLSLGCMTGKGGLSAITVIMLFTFIEPLLSGLQINRYNPLALARIAREVEGNSGFIQTSSGTINYTEMSLCILITAVISTILILLTAYVFKNKRIA
ncbi:MAG: hypothetical protein FWG69_03660 [Oscillospiraceae bacterium]|nr:hypothetical protein [Oscillospiraceae bacterium]